MADVFQTANGEHANFADSTIKVTVNGSDKGRKTASPGETLGAFLNRMASTYGVRTFSAYADGRKLETSQVSGSATLVKEVEITAKDARGFNKMNKAARKRWIFCTDVHTPAEAIA